MSSPSAHKTPENAPVVALHASASSSDQWKPLILDLASHFTVEAFDLPGYGAAPSCDDGSDAGRTNSADTVLRNIERIGTPVHLVGHSTGAGIAIKVALMRPDLVRSLTLYEPTVFHLLNDADPQNQRYYQQIQLVLTQLATAAAEGDAFGGMKRLLDFWSGDTFWTALSEPAQQKIAAMIPQVLADMDTELAETWSLADLDALTMPTLVMMGLESPQASQQATSMLAKGLPNSRLALLPELDHIAPIYQPEWVNARIFEHIAHVERPPANFSWPIQKAA